MKDRIKNPWIFLVLTMIVFVVVSCNPPTGKNPDLNDKRNKTIDSSDINADSQKEEIISFDSIAKTNTLNPGAKTFILDADKSIINWYCVIHTGYAKFKKGKVQIMEGNIVGGDFEICMDSINDVDIDYQLMKDVLVNTLKSSDFFDVNKYPSAHFDLVRVKETSAENFEVVGNLTIKNVTNQIRFNSSIQYQDSLIVVESDRFSIDRTKWGITIYSENFEQTDDSFLFTDLVEIKISLSFYRDRAI